MSIDRISEAVLGKARLEAKEIIEDAKLKVCEKLDQAVKQQEIRFTEAKAAILSEADVEAARIIARSSIESRRELSIAKAEVVETIINRVKEALFSASVNNKAFLELISDSINEIGTGSVILYVREKDISTVRKLINENTELTARVKDVKRYDCLGGVMVEDDSGKNRIDNTYDARLGKLLPFILPEINKELLK